MMGPDENTRADELAALSAGDAGERYRQLRDAGAVEEASQLHKAYFEAHRIRLSADRQVAEATAVSHQPAAASIRHASRERSTIRRVGVALSLLGFVTAAFSAAAGVGGASLPLAAALASVGLVLWLAGIVEDRLIEIRQAIKSAQG